MSSLLLKQMKMARLVPRLLDKLHELGYECTGGDWFRDDRCAYGHQNSLHRKRLALDLNIFRYGKLIENGVEVKEVGEYWESLDPDCRWGGRFGESSPGAGNGWDGGHFSITYRGMR